MAIIANRNFPARRTNIPLPLGETPEAITEDVQGFSFVTLEEQRRVGPLGPQGEKGDPGRVVGGPIASSSWVQDRARGPVGTDQFDSTTGVISAVIDTLEFDTSNGADPQIIHVAGDIFAIAYTGPSNDGFLKTVAVDRAGGIAAAVTATLEFDGGQGERPQIVLLGGNIYVISYVGPSDAGWIATVSIDPDGTISSVIDSLAFDATLGRDSSLIRISSTVVAVVYEGPGTDGFLKTISMTTAGASLAVVDTLEFDTSLARFPKIIAVSGQIYAIAYIGGSGSSLELSTVDIDSSGNIAGGAVVDNATPTAATQVSIDIIKLGSAGWYALIFGQSGSGAEIETVEISDAGTITTANDKNFIFDTNVAPTPRDFFIINVAEGLYAIAYRDGDLKGQLVTIDIQSSGGIGPVRGKLAFDTSQTNDPTLALIPFSNGIYAIAYGGVSGDGFVKTVSVVTTPSGQWWFEGDDFHYIDENGKERTVEGFTSVLTKTANYTIP